MGLITTQQLLFKAATIYNAERVTFSKEEISHQLEEIKHLSTQKKIPKFTLQRDVRHLEDQVQRVFALEQKLLQQKSDESAKVATLKKQIQHLKQKLAVSENPDLKHQLNKMSHLLGECLAKQEVEHEAAKAQEEPSTFEEEADTISRIRLMQQRIAALHHELNVNRQLQQDPEHIAQLEKKVQLIEEKLQQYIFLSHLSGREKGITHLPPPQPERTAVKHKMLLGKNLEGKPFGEAIAAPPQPMRKK